ncbi:hypothetical protein [Absidia glauca]|uniref:Uncharacterized protein n=1 Tax=Absidia glauca TaxID=4829 RepID=A0A163MAW8_ABSGL|nr:hypothetical protein [Absidia glauca]
MNRFASQARRLTTSRGYATATKSTEDFPAETFATSAWKKAAAVVALGAVWYNVDQSMTASGTKNVVTKWVESVMTPSEENNAVNEAFYTNSQNMADYRSFERASPRALTAGTQMDLSDVKVRSA